MVLLTADTRGRNFEEVSSRFYGFLYENFGSKPGKSLDKVIGEVVISLNLPMRKSGSEDSPGLKILRIFLKQAVFVSVNIRRE
jgi:hypothetical protein